jgi:hypothetical protein
MFVVVGKIKSWKFNGNKKNTLTFGNHTIDQNSKAITLRIFG